MPLMHMRMPAGALNDAGRDTLAELLTTAALEVEGLPVTGPVRDTAWIFVDEHPARSVYGGGRPAPTPLVSLEVNTLQGGLDNAATAVLLGRLTNVITEHVPDASVYILVRELASTHWGIDGAPTSLEELRALGTTSS